MNFLVSYYPFKVKPMIPSKLINKMNNKNLLIMKLINNLYQIIVADEAQSQDYFLKLNSHQVKIRKLMKLKINFLKFRKSRRFLVNKNK